MITKQLIDYKEIERKLIEQKNKAGLVGGSLKLMVNIAKDTYRRFTKK